MGIPPEPGVQGPVNSPDVGTGTRRRLGAVAGGLTVVNLLVTMSSLVSGPLQARALSPSGRGELAAILATVGLTSVVADFGLATFAAVETAKGRPTREVIGSVLPLSLVIGGALALAGPFVGSLVAAGRHDVELFVTIGFALMPLTLTVGVLNSINWAEQRWTIWTVVRCIPAFGGLAAIATLYALDDLTVATAAIVAQTASLIVLLPLITVLRRAGRPAWRRDVAAQGLRFGSRAWIYELGSLTNARIDQVIMTRAVSSSELGLYAVAVNASTLQSGISNGIVGAILPRVAGGDRVLVQRAVRSTLLLVGLVTAGLIAVIGTLLPLLFGESYADASSMARILLLASVCMAGSHVLATGLTAGGYPGLAARAQLLGVAITIPGLLLLVGPLGGDGAALVSLAAYAVTFAMLLTMTVRRMGGAYGDYLIPRRDDWALVRSSPLGRGIKALVRRVRRLT